MFRYISLIFLCVFITSCASHKKVEVKKDDTVVYAFDGTGKNIKNGQKTNVYRFLMAHRTNNKSVVNQYARGVGSIDPDNKLASYVAFVPGYFSGAGGKQIVNAMYDRLVDNFKKGHKGIVIVGFSRGAALSRQFANVIAERGDPLKYKKGDRVVGNAPEIKFMALFDTVYSFGSPFGKKDLGYRKSIPCNVRTVAHATAEGEKRNHFDLWSIHPKHMSSNKETGKAVQTGSLERGNFRIEKSFMGGHNDIGGAIKKEKGNKLSFYPLEWVINVGIEAGVSLELPDKSKFTKAVEHNNGWGGRQVYYPESDKC